MFNSSGFIEDNNLLINLPVTENTHIHCIITSQNRQKFKPRHHKHCQG